MDWNDPQKYRDVDWANVSNDGSDAAPTSMQTSERRRNRDKPKDYQGIDWSSRDDDGSVDWKDPKNYKHVDWTKSNYGDSAEGSAMEVSPTGSKHFRALACSRDYRCVTGSRKPHYD